MRRVAPFDDHRTGYDGTYRSDDLGETWTVRVKTRTFGDVKLMQEYLLMIHRPHGDDLVFRPLYRDGFMSLDGTPLHFLRDASGQVTALGITTSGVHDLRFSRDRHVAVRMP
jgi:hypothetical protein